MPLFGACTLVCVMTRMPCTRIPTLRETMKNEPPPHRPGSVGQRRSHAPELRQRTSESIITPGLGSGSRRCRARTVRAQAPTVSALKHGLCTDCPCQHHAAGVNAACACAATCRICSQLHKVSSQSSELPCLCKPLELCKIIKYARLCKQSMPGVSR